MKNFVSGVFILLGALGLIVTLYQPSHGSVGMDGGVASLIGISTQGAND